MGAMIIVVWIRLEQCESTEGVWEISKRTSSSALVDPLKSREESFLLHWDWLHRRGIVCVVMTGDMTSGGRAQFLTEGSNLWINGCHWHLSREACGGSVAVVFVSSKLCCMVEVIFGGVSLSRWWGAVMSTATQVLLESMFKKGKEMADSIGEAATEAFIRWV